MPGCGLTSEPAGGGPDQRRRVGRVARPLGAGDDQRGRAVGLEAEVEQPQRPGDHAGRQVVVHRQRAVVHLGPRVLVGPVAAGDGDGAEVLLVRAVLEHVALGDEAEDLARRQQAVREEELVVGAVAADARRRHRAEPEAAAAAPVERAVHQDVGGQPGDDGRHRLGDLGGRGHATGTGVAVVVEAGHAEGVDQVVGPHEVHVAAHDAVDVLRRQAGVGDRGQRRLGGERQLAAPGVAAEVGPPDPADRAAVAVLERLVVPHQHHLLLIGARP